jgi:excisionase family DNA binding protein
MNTIERRPRSASAPSRARVREVPRLALTPPEAAYSLGVSEDFFTEHIRPELRCVRRGAKVLFPVSVLEAWLEREAARL